MGESLLIANHNPTWNGKHCRMPGCEDEWPCRAALQAQLAKAREHVDLLSEANGRLVKTCNSRADANDRLQAERDATIEERDVFEQTMQDNADVARQAEAGAKMVRQELDAASKREKSAEAREERLRRKGVTLATCLHMANDHRGLWADCTVWTCERDRAALEGE